MLCLEMPDFRFWFSRYYIRRNCYAAGREPDHFTPTYLSNLSTLTCADGCAMGTVVVRCSGSAANANSLPRASDVMGHEKDKLFWWLSR